MTHQLQYLAQTGNFEAKASLARLTNDSDLLIASRARQHTIPLEQDCQKKVIDLILNSPREGEWPLEVAQCMPSPRLMVVLRTYLDTSMNRMSKMHLARDLEPAFQARQLHDFQEKYILHDQIRGVGMLYDDVLVAQLNLGGPLTEMEKARLRTFGYGCDPKERLLELLANPGE